MQHQFTAPPPTRVARTISTTPSVSSSDISSLERAAQVVLDNCGSPWSHRTLNKVCLRFARDVRGTGWDFFTYLTTELALSAEAKCSLRDDPEVQRIFRYGLDPTGEQAVGNVMRQRGF
jgi:hypothetical protein